MIAAQLRALQAKRQLAGWADISLLAGQVTNAVIGTAIVWSTGHIPDPVLAPAIRYAAGLVLLGAARGRTREQLEALVIEAQRMVPTAPRPRDESDHQLTQEV